MASCVRVVPLLFAIALLDELSSGVPTSGAPDFEVDLGLTHAATTLAMFVVPGIAGLVLEPIIFILADRYPRRWFVRGGLVAMTAGSFLAAIAHDVVTMSAAISLWAVGTGAASGLSQATLVDIDPDHRARTMARWTLLSVLGDLIAPILLGGLALSGVGWRAGFAIVGAALALWSAVLMFAPFPQAPPVPDEDEADTGILAAIRDALRDRVLLLWLFGVALCDLLDEILFVFAALHLRQDLGASAVEQSIALVAMVAGGAVGLWILDRLLARGHAERTLLVATCAACALSYAIWLTAPEPWLAAILIVPVGMTSTPMYPLAAAQAYARRPGRSGSVLAASHMFTPLGLLLPWLLGAFADHAGLWLALTLPLLQPVGLGVLALVSRRRVTTEELKV